GDVISAREMKEEVIEPHDVLNLSPRQFLMHSYHGAFFGRTEDVSPLMLKVELPNIKEEKEIQHV
ncbi:MAG: hypothetical protein D6828_01550, partial [Nitrospirae bacterium]